MVSNEETAPDIQIKIVLAFLGFIGLIGSMGNILVILVYRRKMYKNETATFFILVLAISDLVVCLIIVPCTMAVEYLVFKIPAAFCKSYYFLNTSNLLFSTMLISAVALDRYLCICHPLRQYLTVKGGLKLIGALALFSCSFGIASTFIVEVRSINDTTHKLPTNYTTNSNVPDAHINENNYSNMSYICDEIIHFKNITIVEKIIYQVLEKTNHITFIGSILSVVILYSLIFKVVVKIRRTDNKTAIYFQNQNDGDTYDNAELNHLTNNNNNDYINDKNNKLTAPKQRVRSTKSQKSYNKLVNDIKKCQKKKNSQIKKEKQENSLISNETVQNMRSAAMLFVVAVVYIIAFMPVLMISSFKLIQFNLILYNLYYLNSAVNPLIYCFMNSKFRSELKSILLRQTFYSNPI